MSERYLITGIQLGLLVVSPTEQTRKKIVDEIIDKQFIGNSDSGVKDDADLISEMLDK